MFKTTGLPGRVTACQPKERQISRKSSRPRAGREPALRSAGASWPATESSKCQNRKLLAHCRGKWPQDPRLPQTRRPRRRAPGPLSRTASRTCASASLHSFQHRRGQHQFSRSFGSSQAQLFNEHVLNRYRTPLPVQCHFRVLDAANDPQRRLTFPALAGQALA